MQAAFRTPAFRSYANQPLPRLREPGGLHQLTGQTMGTSWSVKFGNPQMRPLDGVRTAIDAALAQVVGQMSTWEAEADISRYNSAEAGSTHTLAPEFAQVLQCALHWARASGGACDPTVGPLVALWGFGAHAGPRRPPSPHELDHARARSGWSRLPFDIEQRRVVQPGGLALDLSGVAKGFAVDQVARALQALALPDFLIDIGGELYGHGRRPDGLPWRVALPQQGTLVLDGRAIATSGDAWHVWEHAGRRYSHTLDPRTGAPITHDLMSATVMHEHCMHADALATALLVLGPVEGMAFAETHGLAVQFVLREATGPVALASPALAALAR